MISPDTIAAVASAPGSGAVGIIRVSGSEAPRLAVALLGRIPQARHANLAAFRDADGSVLDQGLALYFPAPDSFTGEHVLELQGHGGVQVLDLILQRLLALGARLARPGEFSERAFLNGKMDIAQAEAVADLIGAGSGAAAKAAVRSMQGEFSSRIHALQSQLTELRIAVEAAIDFPDEEIDFVSNPMVAQRLARLFTDFDALMASAHQGAALREGLQVVIAGKPNAGKSSLLNRLAGEEVAIVTGLPGTTRDLLRQKITIDGMPLHLVDTAGLRSAADVVEQEGIRRAHQEIARADRVLYILDASLESKSELESDRLAPELALLPAGIPVTLVFNKIDLTDIVASLAENGAQVDDAMPARVYLSARTGAGVELLRAHLKSVAGYRDAEAGTFSARRRHLDALRRAREFVDNAAQGLDSGVGFELFAEDLRLAQRVLGEITGEFTSEDLLGKIFGSFCIGK
jgi:tRNA modification GTPase